MTISRAAHVARTCDVLVADYPDDLDAEQIIGELLVESDLMPDEKLREGIRQAVARRDRGGRMQ